MRAARAALAAREPESAMGSEENSSRACSTQLAKVKQPANTTHCPASAAPVECISTFIELASLVANTTSNGTHNRYAHRSKASGAYGDDTKIPAWAAEGWKPGVVLHPHCFDKLSSSVEVWLPSRRCFQVDCAGLVRRLLQDTCPAAYGELIEWLTQNSGTRRTTDRPYPRAQTFFAFSEALQAQQENCPRHWALLQDLASLKAGDIIVWKLEAGEGHTGHVAVAMGELKLEEASQWGASGDVQAA